MQTGNQTISFSVKSQLAKLLATENISMRHDPSAKTAYFNVGTRLLVLPVWQNISEDLYDMLVVHEVGHALDTPMDKWVEAITTIAGANFAAPTDRHKAVVKGYLNVVEDARIDKLQKRRYPGSRRNYVNGYRELYERDFFGIKKRDVNTLPFIDRINVFFKHGAGFNIKFSEAEKRFVSRIEKSETFDDVVRITSDVLAFSIKQKEAEQKTPTDVDFDETPEADDYYLLDDEVGSDEIDFDEVGSDEDSDIDGSFKGKGADGETEDTDDVDETDETGGEAQSDDKADAPESKTGGNGAGATGNDMELDEPVTEASAQKSMSSIVMNSNYTYLYIKTPEITLSEVVDYFPKVMEDMRREVRNHNEAYEKACQSFLSFRRKEQDAISFMVKEFEMRKAADTYAKTAVAKTGVINTNTLHSYRYNDDIFKRHRTVPLGKNHGFILFLDWSGSMLSDLKNTMKQLLSIVLFCKKVQVPFEVFLFKTGNYNYSRGEFQPNRKTDSLNLDQFVIRNILSSKMNMSTLNKAFTYLWFAAKRSGMKCDSLDNTPLNQAILVADELVNKFRSENKLQVVNTVFLTDGGSDNTNVNYVNTQRVGDYRGTMGYEYFLEDHKTKKNYYVGRYFNGHSVTETLLKMLKDRTDTNLVGFFLTRSLHSAFMLVGVNDDETEKRLKKEWIDNSYVQFKTAGYDSYFVVNMARQDQEHELKVNGDMTQRAVLKEFVKYSEKKLTNRAMLTEFIKLVVE